MIILLIKCQGPCQTLGTNEKNYQEIAPKATGNMSHKEKLHNQV